jgi:hypothetical protein
MIPIDDVINAGCEKAKGILEYVMSAEESKIWVSNDGGLVSLLDSVAETLKTAMVRTACVLTLLLPFQYSCPFSHYWITTVSPLSVCLN